MNVKAVFFGPPTTNVERPVLSPELNAAVAARHSRSDVGLDGILEIIKGCASQDEAVDRVFKHVDYGHRSICDMVPVSIHMEGVSLWLVHLIWSLVSMGGGQETSTRYCDFSSSVNPGLKDDAEIKEWQAIETECWNTYKAASLFWSKVAEVRPDLVGVTPDMPPAKAQRFKNNFVFDRARYAIPMTATTNMNVTTWGTEWIRIISMLRSMPSAWTEAHTLASSLIDEVSLVAPRLIRHTSATGAGQKFWEDRIDKGIALFGHPNYDGPTLRIGKHQALDSAGSRIAIRHNRYHPVDLELSMVPVTYGWGSVAFAEIRDMNRHRPGVRMLDFAPVGNYFAEDQFERVFESFSGEGSDFRELNKEHMDLKLKFLEMFEKVDQFAVDVSFDTKSVGREAFVYFGTLGREMGFHHSNTLGHLIYELELRTGPGTHFRYRKHYMDLYSELVRQVPSLDGALLLGTGEPE